MKCMAKYIKTKGKTPNGGDYSEIYFFDDKGNPIDQKNASRCVIRECKENGELLKETLATCE